MNKDCRRVHKPEVKRPIGEKAMESKAIKTEETQKNHEDANDARLKWTQPHLSPLGVADGTSAAKAYFTATERATFPFSLTSGPS
jgi:hypothetical protein